MKIRKIIMEEHVAEKIVSKHNLKRIIVREVLCDEVGKSYIERVGGDQYIAIGKSHAGYATVIFTYISGTATIKTAYYSTNWQVNLYKKKRN